MVITLYTPQQKLDVKANSEFLYSGRIAEHKATISQTEENVHFAVRTESLTTTQANFRF
jgi:hypothetical protein